MIPASLETWFLGLYLLTLALLYAGLVRIARSTARLALVDRRVRRRRDDSPPHRQDRRQHARGLLPSAAAGVRHRRARPRRGAARPAGARARGGRGRRRHPPDDRDLVRRLDRRRARRRAAAAAAGAGHRCGHRRRRRARPAGRGLPPGRSGWTTRGWRRWPARTICSRPTGASAPWLLNGAYPVVIVATFLARRRRGLTRPGELGLVAGCLALVAVFVATLPLVAAHVAVAVQLQMSRVFWMADLLAMLGIVWWLAEARPAAASRRGGTGRGGAPALGLRRGWPPSPSAAAATRCSSSIPNARCSRCRRPPTPGPTSRATCAGPRRPATHVLADPDHAWRFGTSLRVLAARDVFLENVKDEAMSMYDRRMAQRVAERRLALGDFEARTAPRAAGARPALRSRRRRLGARAGAAGALPQPAVQGLSPHAVTTSTALPPTTPREALAPAAYVAHPRWTGGHWMTIYTWARRRRFARLPAPEARVLRRRARRPRARARPLAAGAARGADAAGAARPRRLEHGALHGRPRRQGVRARLQRRAAEPAQLRRHRVALGGPLSLRPDRTIRSR